VAPSVYGAPANSTSKYFIMSGTSMATPVVAGTAAILLSQNPALRPDQIKAKLMLTATKNFPASSSVTDPTTGTVYTSYYDIFTVGAGYLDVTNAISNSNVVTGAAVSPVSVFNSTTDTVTIVNANQIAWDDGGGDDDSGDSVLFPMQIAWDDGGGDDDDSGCMTLAASAVWGSSVLVNGTNTAWTAASTPLAQSSTQAFSTLWGSSASWAASSSEATAFAKGDPK